MDFKQTQIEGVWVLEPRSFADERGFFLESFRRSAFDKIGLGDTSFLQDNHSRSDKGVLRGLHYQLDPYAQAKLVQVVRGKIFDVAVDIRPKSPTFGRWVSQTLSDENHRMMYIAPGFAHGFYALEPSDVIYKVTRYYSPQHERGILWNDPALGIPWPLDTARPSLSPKDAVYPMLEDAPLEGVAE